MIISCLSSNTAKTKCTVFCFIWKFIFNIPICISHATCHKLKARFYHYLCLKCHACSFKISVHCMYICDDHESNHRYKIYVHLVFKLYNDSPKFSRIVYINVYRIYCYIITSFNKISLLVELSLPQPAMSDIPDSPTALMPHLLPTAATAADDDVQAIVELDSKRLSTKDKVQEWLKCVGKQQQQHDLPISSPSLVRGLFKQLLTTALGKGDLPMLHTESASTVSGAVRDLEKEVGGRDDAKVNASHHGQRVS